MRRVSSQALSANSTNMPTSSSKALLQGRDHRFSTLLGSLCLERTDIVLPWHLRGLT